MAALESERAHDQATPAPADIAPPQQEAPAGPEMTAEGPVPEVAAGAVAGATASERAFEDRPKHGQIAGGLYKPEEYHAACEAAGLPERWDPRYVRGHTDATQWTQPYEGRYDNVFELKRNCSAAQAVQDFVAGPTVADFRAIAVALELDELRSEIGDKRFDEMFGSTDSRVDARISPAQRLKITSAMYTTPFAKLMLELAHENEALEKSSEPEPPAIAAGIEQTPSQDGASQAAPELVAAELGVQPEREHA